MIKGPSLHAGQQRAVELIKGPAKYVTVVAPRQTGKSFLAMQCLLYWSLNDPGSITFFVSPTYQQAKKPMEELYNAIAQSGIVKTYNRSDFFIELKNGSKLYFKSTERADNLRGYTATYLCVDEAAYHGEEVWSSVLKPILLAKGKKCLFISTPSGSNWFKRMYDAGQDEDQPDYVSCRMHYTENPYLNVKDLEEARATLPAHIFEAEYEGSFTESGARVFSLQNTVGLNKWGLNQGRISCGIDLGKANDYTVATFMNEKGEVIDVYRENQTDWSIMVAEIVKRLKKYQAHAYIEVNSMGDVVAEMIRNQYPNIEPFVTTMKSKNEIIEGLAVDLMSGTVKVPSAELFPPMWFELDIFEYSYSHATRNIKYSSPRGFHDDCVMSLAICNLARKNHRNYGNYTYMVRSM